MAVPIFPDMEAVTLSYLREKLPAGIRFGTYVPGEYAGPEPFVMARRIGGFMRWPALDTATLDIEVWGGSREETHDLAQLITGELMATRLTAKPFARVVVIAGLVYMVDDLTELHRWVMTFQISTRPIERG